MYPQVTAGKVESGPEGHFESGYIQHHGTHKTTTAFDRYYAPPYTVGDGASTGQRVVTIGQWILPLGTGTISSIAAE